MWIRAFLAGTHGAITRRFTLEDYHGTGTPISITTDASPWGIGGWLKIGSVITEYFSDQLHAQDLQRLGVRIGGCEGQQALEALAVVVALRLWKQVWAEKRSNITVKSDNVTALVMTATLKGKKGPVAMLARELALDIADGVYTPNVVAHIPGVANDSADALSRKYQPSKHFVLPRLLANAKEVTAPRRDNHWWRCSAAQEQMAHTGR